MPVYSGRNMNDTVNPDPVLLRTVESLGTVAVGVGHDLNNLLTVILGNAQLALASGPAPQVREHLDEIVRATQRASELCRQLLVCSGQGSATTHAVDLADVVQAALDEFCSTCAIRPIVRMDPHAGLVQGDADQLRQVVLNLLRNAAEALGGREGELLLATGTTTCTRERLEEAVFSGNAREGPYAFIEVRDSGCGMSRETVQRMFDPFFSTKFVGRGLGLSAVFGVVRSHGGAIEVSSEVGRGTTCRVLLPTADAERVRQTVRPAVGADAPAQSAVLVVDDELSVRTLVCRALENEGFCVLAAGDGLEAVELFRRHRQIACVLLDLSMPGMDGEETLTRLRQVRQDVRVLLCSGYGQRYLTRRFSNKDVLGWLPKPFNLADLVRHVRRAMKYA
jgi:nitrogen-specific signal transduction histidine kinase/CheY-like chemotaxis protein